MRTMDEERAYLEGRREWKAKADALAAELAKAREDANTETQMRKDQDRRLEKAEAELAKAREALLACRERAETGGLRIETAMDACEDISEIATCALPPEGWQRSKQQENSHD